MKKGILGYKLGMSQIFAENGRVIPVTIVEAGPCPIVQVKTAAKEGYDAVQIGFDGAKLMRDGSGRTLSKPVNGHYKKAGVAPQRHLRELRLDDAATRKVGECIVCSAFEPGDLVAVTATSRGHGFSGVIKRWNHHRVGPMSHGTGPIHRSVGSTGACSSPSRVFKNRKMPGQYGNARTTVRNLEVVRVDAERNLLFIKGGIPGPKGALVVVRM